MLILLFFSIYEVLCFQIEKKTTKSVPTKENNSIKMNVWPIERATIVFMMKLKMNRRRYILTILLFFYNGWFGVLSITSSVRMPDFLKSFLISMIVS